MLAIRRPRRAIAAIALLSLAVAAGLFAARMTAPGEVDRTPLGLAQSLMSEGDFLRAAATLRAAYRAQPSEPLRLALARTLLIVGDDFNAHETLRAPFSEQAFEREADYLRAESLIRLRRYEAAATLAETIVRREPSGSALLLAARAAYAAGRTADAASLSGEAVRAGGPSLGDAWLFRARRAFDVADLAVAASAIARAREAGAPARDLAASEIELKIREGAFDAAAGAIANYRAHSKHRSRTVDPGTEYLVAMQEAATGDYVTAARRLRAIETALGAMPNGLLMLAMAQDQAGDVAQADGRFRALIEETPANAIVVAVAGERLVAANRFDEARRLIERIHGQAPAAEATYLRLSLALSAADYEAAIDAAKALARLPVPVSPAAILFGPHSVAAAQHRARHERAKALVDAANTLLTGDGRLAARAARDNDLASADPALATVVGELYLAAGEDERAAAAFDRALAAAPTLASAMTGRVRVAVRADRLDAAEAVLRRSLETAPEFLAARTLLARVLLSAGRATEAASVLNPAEHELLDSTSEAPLYAGALKEARRGQELVAFAGRFGRLHPADPAAAAVFDIADLSAEAAAAAREALLAAPDAPDRVDTYRAAMRKIGAEADSEAFLAVLAQRPPRGAASAPAGSASVPPAPTDLAGLRRAYLAAPGDAATVSRFGTALTAAGDARGGARVMREACFWSVFADCRSAFPPRS